MRVFVKLMNMKKVPFDVEPEDTIYSLKEKIQMFDGMSPCVQRIIYKGQQLHEKRMIADYNIQNDSLLHLVMRNSGG